MRRMLVVRESPVEEVELSEVHHHTHHHKHHHHHAKEEGEVYVAPVVIPAVAEIVSRLESPPATWRVYKGHSGGAMSIVEMEYRELMQAKAEGTEADIEKELTDLAAACANALIEIGAK